MVFISYSRRDYYFAESLAFQLIKHDIDVWFDSKDLEPSTDWSEAIDSAIDAASCLILVVSPDSWKSTIVRREWQRARSQGKRIIVVLFRTKTIPQELESAEVIDFRGAFEPALKQLVYNLTSSNTNLTVSSHRLGLAFRWPPAVVTTVLLLACAFLIPLLLNPNVYREGIITLLSFIITKLIAIGLKFDSVLLHRFLRNGVSSPCSSVCAGSVSRFYSPANGDDAISFDFRVRHLFLGPPFVATVIRAIPATLGA